MGNTCNFQSSESNIDLTVELSKSQFNFMYVIGRGGFGKVWKVERKKNKQIFAMKEMGKARVIAKRSVNSVMNERKLLAMLRHPFLVNMQYAFQDRDNVYLVMDFLTGGDLRYHIGKNRIFSEQQTKFFMACVLTALEYLHINGILHRDIKPENLVMDQRGYLRVTDLGIARMWNPDNAKDTSGTPGYMAPEVMCRQNHGIAVDYFAVGVMGYECMLGRRPYIGKSRKEIRDAILAKQVQIKRSEIPNGWSLEAADFINKLLQRKPMNRLGQHGPTEVKQHAWLKNYPWQALLEKTIEAPYLPSNKEDNFDGKQLANPRWNDITPEVLQENQKLLLEPNVQQLFQGYYFDIALQSNCSRINTEENTQYMDTSQINQKKLKDLNQSQQFQQQLQKQLEKKLGESASQRPNSKATFIRVDV